MLGKRKPRAWTAGMTGSTDSTLIEVYFSGPSVEEHSMSVRDLAPALIGLADAIDQYKELTAPFLDLDVKITATKAGSFDVFLQLLGMGVSLMQGAEPTNVIQLASGLMDVIKILVARFQATGDPTPKDGEMVRHTDTSVDVNIGGLSITVDRKAYIASRNGAIINSLGAAAKPATSDGYNPVRFIHDDSGKRETIDGATAEALGKANLSDQPIDTSTETTVLQIDTIQFNSDKWKFSRGDEKIWCEIKDQAFLARCLRREIAFHGGELLKVRLQTEQYVRGGKLKTGRRTILDVIDIIPIEQQPQLDI